jgi:prolyl-tRNA synthetase
VDDRDTHKPGFKFAEWEQKGVPVRLAMGPRDLQNDSIEMARRDTKTKEIVPSAGISDLVKDTLDQIQSDLYNKALDFQQKRTYHVDTWDDFVDVIDNKQGFAVAHWNGNSETEEKIKELTKATIRCIPLDNNQENGKCVLTGEPSTQRVIFAKSY